MTDEQLLARAGEGDPDAFIELYERHRDALFRFAYRMVSSTSVAEDITHDCFVSLIKEPGRFDPTRAASLRTYLFAAARNLTFKRFRKLQQEPQHDEEFSVKESATTNEMGPLDRLLDDELAEKVREAINRLPPLQREVLVLCEYEEMTLGEIASVIKTDVGTAKARLYRARQNLKKMLAPYLVTADEAVAVERS